MKFMRRNVRSLIPILALILLLGGAAPKHVSACNFLYDVMLTYSDLFDPVLPWWHPVKPYWLGTSQEDYNRLGMVQGTPEIWEDGMRVDPNGYSFEWWYNDAHFADGSSVVVVYFTKPQFTPGLPLTPVVSITIVTATGETIERTMFYDPADSFYSTEQCNVQIGPNQIIGDLANYTIYANIDDVEVDLTLQRIVPTWRPGTGHLFFGDAETYYAWLPAVSSGQISGTMTYNGETHQVTGSGYHDHNWGVTDVSKHLKYWWWSRIQVGPYTVIGVNQRMKNKYGTNKWQPVFVILDENGALIDEAEPDVTMTHTETNVMDHPDPAHPGTIAHTVTFRAQKTNGDWAEIQLNAAQMLASADLLLVSGMSDVEIFMARLLGKDPWYTRFLANATLSFNIDGVEYSGYGIGTLELMDME